MSMCMSTSRHLVMRLPQPERRALAPPRLAISRDLARPPLHLAQIRLEVRGDRGEVGDAVLAPEECGHVFHDVVQRWYRVGLGGVSDQGVEEQPERAGVGVPLGMRRVACRPAVRPRVDARACK